MRLSRGGNSQRSCISGSPFQPRSTKHHLVDPDRFGDNRLVAISHPSRALHFTCQSRQQMDTLTLPTRGGVSHAPTTTSQVTTYSSAFGPATCIDTIWEALGVSAHQQRSCGGYTVPFCAPLESGQASQANSVPIKAPLASR